MYLLLDECCAKALVTVALLRNHRVERTIAIGSLGRGAADEDIFAFARQHGAVVVTINRGDFIALARYGNDHPGVILLPSVPRPDLVALFELVLPVAEQVLGERTNAFVEIDAAQRISSFKLP
jgi:predicted nuclease of predicted toxin-antitoxin system